MDSQPMDFFVRQLEPALTAARDRLAALSAVQSSQGINPSIHYLFLKKGGSVFRAAHQPSPMKQTDKQQGDNGRIRDRRQFGE